MLREPSASRIALVLAALSGLAGCNAWDVRAYPVPADDPAQPPVPEEAVVTLDPAPPPISGGTMLVARSLGLVVGSDPDRDAVWVVEPAIPGAAGRVVGRIDLQPGDEPGRLVESADGRVHVALRRGGAVATIDLVTGEIVDRTAVCSAPRGLAYDAASGVIHVACARGELVTLPAAGGAEIRRVRLDEDLRDVVVDGDRLLVSRFRSAEILAVDATGAVTARVRPPGDHCAPTVAWRMAPLPNGGAIVLHQLSQLSPVVTTTPDAYGQSGPCGDGIVSTTISVIPPQSASPDPVVLSLTNFVPQSPVSVDVAVTKGGDRIGIASVSNGWISELSGNLGQSGWDSVFVDTFGSQECWNEARQRPCQVTAMAYDDAGHLLFQSREPALLAGVRLPGDSVYDTAHEIFHQNLNQTIACASCHPEGREDGHAWFFEGFGLRRTQTLAGGLLATSPFHWDGDLPSLDALMTLVFEGRMGGPSLGPNHVEAVGRWLDTIPAEPPRDDVDLSAAARGAQIFTDPAVGCAACHGGPQHTNNKSFIVGTGGEFQVPRLLGVGARAPFMHDGCAATLHDRFGVSCGGGDEHGRTSHLAPEQIDDLVVYLETL